ncbi:helix-turn-helix domain-containing protein [Patescibacteria group bacterium]|nr:helix-turn-helix domain-containing protein [Patescibacteria group bacterium]
MANRDFSSKGEAVPHTIGEIFYYERNRRRYTLSQIAKELNIRKTYLELLEDDALDKLPADVYTKNYVKRYADFLHVDSDAMIELYEKEKNVVKKVRDEDDPGKVFSEKKRKFSFILTPKIARRFGILLLVVVFLFYIWYQVSDLSAPPELTIIEPSQNETTITETSVLVIGETSQDAALTINGEPIHLTSDGTFQETIALQKGINELKFEVVNKLGKKREVEKKVYVE